MLGKEFKQFFMVLEVAVTADAVAIPQGADARFAFVLLGQLGAQVSQFGEGLLGVGAGCG